MVLQIFSIQPGGYAAISMRVTTGNMFGARDQWTCAVQGHIMLLCTGPLFFVKIKLPRVKVEGRIWLVQDGWHSLLASFPPGRGGWMKGNATKMSCALIVI